MFRALFSAAKAYLAVKAVDMIAEAFRKRSGTASKNQTRRARSVAQAARAPASKSRSVPTKSRSQAKGRKAA